MLRYLVRIYPFSHCPLQYWTYHAVRICGEVREVTVSVRLHGSGYGVDKNLMVLLLLQGRRC